MIMSENPIPKTSNMVGLITLTGQFNYGNRLQLFATSEAYKSFGYCPIALEMPDDCVRIEKIVRKLRLLLGDVPGDDPQALSTDGRLAAFKRFAAKLNSMRIVSSKELDLDSFRYFSVGSDQVWNPGAICTGRSASMLSNVYHWIVSRGRAKHLYDWYFLGFCRKDQRIALAPSLGVDHLDSSQARAIAHGVGNFSRVSVREGRGAGLIEECSGAAAEVICDPTLVLTAEKWRSVADGRCTPSTPYVLTYLLGGAGPEADAVLDRVTGHGQVPVIPLSDRQKTGEPDAGPAEFIDLIDHASHVVTDSFHAAVFSSILHTPLTITHREGGTSMFSRLEQLSQMLGIEEKVYGSPTYDLARAGEYDGVDEAIAREREKFMSYLGECLNG